MTGNVPSSLFPGRWRLWIPSHVKSVNLLHNENSNEVNLGQFELIRPYFFERRFHLVAGLSSLLVVDILQLFIPRIIKRAIDGIAVSSITGKNLFYYAFYIIMAAILIGIFRFCWRYFIMGTARRVEEGIRERLFNHIITMPAPFF